MKIVFVDKYINKVISLRFVFKIWFKFNSFYKENKLNKVDCYLK